MLSLGNNDNENVDKDITQVHEEIIIMKYL
jgi:hypothetical protein